LEICCHLVLLIGVAIVAFPVYLAVIASTHDNAVIANGQMPLYPGTHGLETYWNTIVSGTGRTTRQPVGADAEQPDHGARLAAGKSSRHLGLCDRVFRVSVRMTFWTIFITLMLPVECASSRPTRSPAICTCWIPTR
jgi:sn-glycerol 3-phosphate transport system permease protein